MTILKNVEKRKRGRPRKTEVKKIDKKVNSLNIINNIIEKTKLDTRSVVVRLPINIQFDEIDNVPFMDSFLLNYDPNIQEPLPFEPFEPLNMIEHEQVCVEKTEEDKQEKSEYELIDKDHHTKNTSQNILVDLIDHNTKNKLIKKTDICCWWCCHQFKNSPIGLPIKHENSQFFVKGCFCSFNCALSYNNDSNSDNSSEYESLLYLLFKKMNNATEFKEIQEAPPRESLKMFGGLLSIDEFRNSFDIKYEIIYPPMLAIIPKLEETQITNKLNFKLRDNFKKKNKKLTSILIKKS
jgi:hypothetical protein